MQTKTEKFAIMPSATYSLLNEVKRNIMKMNKSHLVFFLIVLLTLCSCTRGMKSTNASHEQIDSLIDASYSAYAVSANDSIKGAELIANLEQLRSQLHYYLPTESKEEMEHFTRIEVGVFASIILIILLAYTVDSRRKERLSMIERYRTKLRMIEALRLDREKQHTLIVSLQEEAVRQRNKLEQQGLMRTSKSLQKQEFEHGICARMHRYGHDVVRGTSLVSSDDWIDLYRGMDETDHEFVVFVLEQGLSTNESRIAYLMRLQFTDDEISVLIGSRGSSYTNYKQRLNKKLFNQDSAKDIRKAIINWV